ncbi:hypothetical protein B0H19DRAFT_380085 [Mycena capillaripes]|nr:hypothetical protein B0H19DRAFT_380085 [Mycena capillaripes]
MTQAVCAKTVGGVSDGPSLHRRRVGSGVTRLGPSHASDALDAVLCCVHNIISNCRTAS